MSQLHNRIAGLLCVPALLLGAPSASAEDAPASFTVCGERAADAVQKRYRDVQDIRADFVQTSRAVGPGGAQAPTVASGTVVLQVPGKMRWTYQKPEESLLVSDGETLWLYDPAFAEAQKLPANGDYLSGAAIQFLLGKGNLREEFDIQPIGCDAGVAELRLTPKAAATYEYLTIWVDPADGLISRTEIADLLGNRTLVEFRNMALNRQPEDSIFRFEPPAGVSVVELTPSP